MNLKQLTNQAFSLHQKGQFEEAENMYKSLLELYPDNANLLNLYGMLCMQLRKFSKAISLLSRAAILGDSAYIMTNLGKAYLYSGDTEKAIKIFEDAKELEQPNDDLLYSLGIAYRRLNNNKKAINAYKCAIEFNPNNYNVCYNLALLLGELGEFKEAINYASKCLLITPNSEEMYVMLAGFYEKQNDVNMAILNWEKAADINPKQYLYFYNLGVLYSKIDNKEKAIQSYRNSLLINPNFVEALINLAILYKNSNINLALEFILKAYEISPNEKNVVLNYSQILRDLSKNTESIKVLLDFLQTNNSAEAYSQLGINYMDIGEYNMALDVYNKALEIDSTNPNYLHSKSTALKYLGKTQEAKIILEKVVKENPEIIQSNISLGMIYLSEKDFQKGMPLYMQRSLETKIQPSYLKKIWKESYDINNKKILIYSDCGLGDTIMFARYLPFVQKISASIVLQTDKELVSILKSTYEDITIIPKSEKYDDFDIVIPIMNLPYVLNMDFSNIPCSDSYLKTDISYTVKEFNTNKLKVGICFKGNNKILKNRFIPDEIANQIFNVAGVDFYTFKNNINGAISLDSYIKDYSDTAYLLSKLDLLITIDSSIAHMAGALGVKTFLLLPHTAEWRWFDDKKITPWYNSVEIFKQDNIGDWQTVIDKIKKELINYDIK